MSAIGEAGSWELSHERFEGLGVSTTKKAYSKETLAANFLGAIHLAAVTFWL